MLNCLKVPHICPHWTLEQGPQTPHIWAGAGELQQPGPEKEGSVPCLPPSRWSWHYSLVKRKQKTNHINTGREWWLLAAFLHPFSPLRVPLDPGQKCYTE